MDRKLLDDIYLTLQGLYLPSHAVPGVPNLFQPFGYCERKYTAAREAYERLCLRLVWRKTTMIRTWISS